MVGSGGCQLINPVIHVKRLSSVRRAASDSPKMLVRGADHIELRNVVFKLFFNVTDSFAPDSEQSPY